MNFLGELKRRNVFRMGVFYLLSAWVVLQVADVLVGVVGLPDWTMRLVGLVLLLCLPLVLVLSWVYELTPEGLKKDDRLDEAGRQVTVSPFQRLVLVLSFAVVMVGGYLLIERFLVEQQQTTEPVVATPTMPRTEPVTIVMLPIEPDPAPTFIENGEKRSLTEKLFRVVEDFEDIRALPPERVTPPEESDQTARELAKEQFATHWFISHTREQDGSVWLNTEIVDAETGERVWAYSLEEPVIVADDLYAAGLARLWFEMGKTLEAQGLTEMAADTDDPLAFEAYWRGQYEPLAHLPPDKRFDQQLAWFDEALLLDPEFVAAYNEIARLWFRRTHAGVPWADVREQSLSAATRALELGPNDPNANANMARILILEMRLSQDPDEWQRLQEESLELARKAVQLAPRNAKIREDYIRALWNQKDWNEVVNQIQIIVRYKPDDAEYLDIWMLEPLVWAERLEEAEAHLALLQEKYPHRRFQVGSGAFTIHLAKGEYIEALEALHPTVRNEPDVWTQDYMNLLSDLGALEAVDRWGRYLADFGEGSTLNFVWGYVVSANKHLGRMESALNLVDELPDSVLSPQQKDLEAKDIAYLAALKGEIGDPATTNQLAQLGAFCAQFEQGQVAEANGELSWSNVTVATKCFVLSARTGSDHSRLGDAVLRFFEQIEPFKQGPPGSLHRVNFSKMLLIYTLARMGKAEEALDEFREIYEQGFSRPHIFRTYAVVPDLEGIYGGLGSHPEFLEMIDNLEARNSALRSDIEERAPWLFDPALSSPYLDWLESRAVDAEDGPAE